MNRSKRDLIIELAHSNPCYKEVSKVLDLDVGTLLEDRIYKNTCSVCYNKDEMEDILNKLGKPNNTNEFENLVRMAVYCWAYLNNMYCTVVSMSNVPFYSLPNEVFLAMVEVNFFGMD